MAVALNTFMQSCLTSLLPMFVTWRQAPTLGDH